MKKLIILALLIVITFQIEKGKGKLRNKLKQDGYVEETQSYGQFDNERNCKIRKCIKSKDIYHKIQTDGYGSPAVNKYQQECFYNCEIQVCQAKHLKPEDIKQCKIDENGQEKKTIFDPSDPQFKDYAPSKAELDSYLSVDDDKVVRKFKDTHYGYGF